MRSGRVISTLLLAVLPACESGSDIGNCSAIHPQVQICWEQITRDSCDSAGGQFTSKRCAELGFGCPDGQAFQARSVCVARCEAANAHLADCGIVALDCSENAALSRPSCVNTCLTVDECDDLRASPLGVCAAHCTTFVPD
jgi:hypothetical protein